MPTSSVALRTAAALLLPALALACMGSAGPITKASHAPAPAAPLLERLTVRTGEQIVTVDSTLRASRHVQHLVDQAGGYVERSSGSNDGNATIQCRVPAAKLDGIMDGVAALGKERRRHLTGADVTDQYGDLEARLRSNIALRNRLHDLLARAATLEEVLTLEKQISRLQSEIDAQQARLERLQSQAELAALSVTFEHEHRAGPVTRLGKGLVQLVAGLF